VYVGKSVKQGEVIATVGATDNYSRPKPPDPAGAHLHFEIYVNDVTVDPMPYLLGELSLFNMPSKTFGTSDTGTTNEDADFRTTASATGTYVSEVTPTIPKGSQVQCEGYSGDFLKVTYNGNTGYVYSKYVTRAENTPKTYSNPSKEDIKAEIRKQCNNVGLEPEIGLATAWAESRMTQFISGHPYKSETPGDESYGIMQINIPAHHEYNADLLILQ
jgi:hypothetical protein